RPAPTLSVVRSFQINESSMVQRHLSLITIEGSFVICRLDADAAVPSWASGGKFFSITRTKDELSIVCPKPAVPEGVRCESGWRCLRVAGTMDFSQIGVLA